MHRFLTRIGSHGYTLVESLFQLIVFAIFAQLFLLFFLWKEPIERNYAHLSQTAWELFTADFQQELLDVYELEAHLGGHGIRLWNDRGRIDIQHGNAVIRKVVAGKGHIPLLTNVHSTTFTIHGSTVVVNVTMLDGTSKERDFAIGIIEE